MCKTYKVLPDSDFIENMNPVMKAWMFNNWVEDQNDEFELLKNIALIEGSFTNPQAVKQMLGKDKKEVAVSDEEFEQSFKLIEKINEQQKPLKKRKRKILSK